MIDGTLHHGTEVVGSRVFCCGVSGVLSGCSVTVLRLVFEKKEIAEQILYRYLKWSIGVTSA